MTHHEKLVERYEDALFALMMEDVAETEGEKLQELNEQLKRNPAAEIPKELDERCIRTIRTEFGKKNFRSARRGAVPSRLNKSPSSRPSCAACRRTP